MTHFSHCLLAPLATLKADGNRLIVASNELFHYIMPWNHSNQDSMRSSDDKELIHDEENRQFRMEIEGFIALVDYHIQDNVWVLTHTKVPQELGGRGIGTRLVQMVLDALDEKNIQVIPQCPFIAAFIEKRPKYQHMVQVDSGLS